MATINVTLTEPLRDGMEVKFQAPCDCTAVTGLTLTYPTNDGTTASRSMVFMDAHGNRLTGVGNLFVEGSYIKVLADTTNNVAYIQNADTNSYLEGEFDKLRALHLDDGNGCYYRTVDGEVEWINPPMVVGTEYRTTERFSGKPVYTAVTTLMLEGIGLGPYAWTINPPAGTVDLILKWTGFTSTGIVLPFNVNQPEANDHRFVQVSKTTAGAITLDCRWGRTAYSAGETWYIQLWYTKE